MNSTEAESQAWNEFLIARAHNKNLWAVYHEFGYFEFDDSIFEHPVSAELRALLLRAKELSDEIEKFESEIDGSYQDAAWHYMAVAFDLHRGDQIQIARQGGVDTIYCDSVWSQSEDRAGFVVNGRIVRKDGSPGKRTHVYHLAAGNWTIVRRASENVPPSQVVGYFA